MPPAGSILWLRDRGGRFPTFRFEADTDQGTSGWLSFTALNRVELVLAEASADEWNAGAAGTERSLQRIAREAGRTDLRSVRLLRIGNLPSGRGLPFRMYRALWPRAQLVYSSLDGSPEASVDGEQTVAQFVECGGRLSVHRHSTSTGALPGAA